MDMMGERGEEKERGKVEKSARAGEKRAGRTI